MSAAATAAGYLYASGRLRRRKTETPAERAAIDLRRQRERAANPNFQPRQRGARR